MDYDILVWRIIFLHLFKHIPRAPAELSAGPFPVLRDKKWTKEAQQRAEHIFIVFLPSPLRDFYTALPVNTGIPKTKPRICEVLF